MAPEPRRPAPTPQRLRPSSSRASIQLRSSKRRCSDRRAWRAPPTPIRSSSTCRRSIQISTRALATRFREATGGRWIDCPLSGGAPGALAGRLTVMAGGEEADFERARAVMSSPDRELYAHGAGRRGPSDETRQPGPLRHPVPGGGGGRRTRRARGRQRRTNPVGACGRPRRLRASCRSSERRWPLATIRRPEGWTTC